MSLRVFLIFFNVSSSRMERGVAESFCFFRSCMMVLISFGFFSSLFERKIYSFFLLSSGECFSNSFRIMV